MSYGLFAMSRYLRVVLAFVIVSRMKEMPDDAILLLAI
jgi:hypothetical protein